MRNVLLTVLISILAIASAGAESVTLKWDPNQESDLGGYKIYRFLGLCPSPPIGPPPLASVDKSATTYVDAFVPAGTADVCYAITAFDTSGNESAQSNQVTKHFDVPPVIGRPDNFTVAFEGLSATFTVTPVLGAIAYDIRIHEAGTPYDPCESMVLCERMEGTVYTITLKENTSYDAWVHAVDANGVRGEAQGLTFTTPNIPPAVPSGLQIVSQSAGEIVILAARADCASVQTSTAGSTKTHFKRTVRCNK